MNLKNELSFLGRDDLKATKNLTGGDDVKTAATDARSR